MHLCTFRPHLPFSDRRAQFDAIFLALRDHVLSITDDLYLRFSDVLTYRGVDYASVCVSTHGATAPVEFAEPTLRQVSHLLK